MESRIAQRHRRSDGDAIARVDAHWVEVFDRTDDDYIVVGIAKQLQLVLFPAEYCLLYQHLVGRGGVETPTQLFIELIFGMHEATAVAPQRIARAYHEWETDLLSGLFTLQERVGDIRRRDAHPDFLGMYAEFFAVLGQLDGIEVGTEYAHTVLFP